MGAAVRGDLPAAVSLLSEADDIASITLVDSETVTGSEVAA